jgi:hypothetical protein
MFLKNILTIILKFFGVVRTDATDETNDTQEPKGDTKISSNLLTLAPRPV